MGNKKLVQELLDGMSEDELDNLASMIAKGVKSRTKKRGRGKRKKKKAAQPSRQDASCLDGIALSPDEQQEIAQASAFDRAKGFDQPKPDGIIPAAPRFQKVTAKCMICGKESEISPALLPPEQDRFKCNACSCRAR